MPPSPPLLLCPGALFDAPAGRLVRGMRVLVRGGRVEAVGRGVEAPEGARVVEMPGCTLLPGLIDTHTHLLLEAAPDEGMGAATLRSVVLEGEALRTLRGAGRARSYLDAGITTVRDLGNAGVFCDVALRDAIAEGSVPGPRMYVSGPGLSPAGGQADGLQYRHRALAGEEYRVVAGVADAVAAVREHVFQGVDLLKVYADTRPNRAFLSVAELRAICDEAHLFGLRVAAHATGDASVERALEAGVDSIEHAYTVSTGALERMAERGVVLVPTDMDTLLGRRHLDRLRLEPPLTEEQLSDAFAAPHDRLRRALAAGVTVAAGSDMYLELGMPRGEAARRVLFAYAEAGMAPALVLQAATCNAARLLGEPGLGVVEPGAHADLVAVEGDPLADLHSLDRVRLVVRAGNIWRGEHGAAPQ